MPNLDALSEELKTHVLSSLEAIEVLNVSSLNRKWYRIANDEQIWKHMLHRDYPQTRKLPHQSSHKSLYRLQSNWRRGKASPLRLGIRRSVLPSPPPELDRPNKVATHPAHRSSNSADTIVAFAGQYILTASRKADPSTPIPPVQVEFVLPDGSSRSLGSVYAPSILDYYAARPHLSSPSFALSVTEMRLDKAHSASKDSLHLAVFYSSGQFALLMVHFTSPADISVAEEYASTEVTADPITQARYHCPLLVTLSQASVLRFHLIRRSAIDAVRFNVVLSHPPMRSDLVWQPASLSLKRTSKSKFKASLVYSTPFFSYPSCWTLAMQEFHLSLPKTASTDELAIATHSAMCMPHPATSQSSPLITALHQSDQYIAASRLDNTIDLFEITPASPRNPLAVHHRRTLFGHSGPVKSVMLQGTRCVSGGRDGKLRVWDLQGKWYDEGVEVTEEEVASEEVQVSDEAGTSVEWVAFDAEKIVCLESPCTQTAASKEDRIRVLSFNGWERPR